MHRTAVTSLAAAALSLPLAAGGGPYLNELYISHSGTDDREFVEIVGTPGASLDDFMLLVVEGDSVVAGTLDRAIDLSGHTFPSDGHFVVGTDKVENVDLVAGTANIFENGTETFYLLEATDVAAVQALLGTDVTTGPTTTVIPTLGTIHDLVGMTDGDDGDVVYDSAFTLGPDGSFFPAGIFRPLNDSSTWCDLFLDFGADQNETLPRTPGVLNVPCTDPTPMRASTFELSLAAGGTIDFSLDAGAGNAGMTYWVLGSVSGTSPGFAVQGVTIPLNLDPYTFMTINAPNSPVHQATFGVLDGSGQGSASLNVPAGIAPVLAGTTICHAYGVIDLSTLTLVEASNAICATLHP